MVTLGHGKRQYEHIMSAERAIGRPLKNFGRGNPRTEVVHHINGNKTDNRPNNAQLTGEGKRSLTESSPQSGRG